MAKFKDTICLYDSGKKHWKQKQSNSWQRITSGNGFAMKFISENWWVKKFLCRGGEQIPT